MNTRILNCAAKLSVRADGTARTFSGYASAFNVQDSYGDIIQPGAFTRSLSTRPQPAMLWQHDTAAPCGVWEEVREDSIGLYVRGRLVDTALGRDAYTLLKENALNGLSIGFITRDSKPNPDGTGGRLLLDVDLLEISIVTFPANTSALVSNVRAERSDVAAHQTVAELGVVLSQLSALNAAHGAVVEGFSRHLEALSHRAIEHAAPAEPVDHTAALAAASARACYAAFLHSHGL